MNRYKIISKIGEGTFSEVVKMRSLRDGNYYACKKMKQEFESIDQVNNLREIQALRRLGPHPNILLLHEVIFDQKSGCLALICELMDMNIYELIRGRRYPLSENKIKSYMYQLCKSLDHIHRNGIFHRDVKPENILVKKDMLKLGDFGSCRSVYSKQPYTEYISTRWYRAPECLLTDGYYSYKMDMWSAGCVFFEVISLRPLFPGSNELDQISKIHEIIGTPTQNTLRKFKQSRAMSFDFPLKKGTGLSLHVPGISPESLALMYAMIEYDPDERISAKQALQHAYFRDIRVQEKRTIVHRKTGGAESSGTAGSNYLWHVARQTRKQKNPPARNRGPIFPVELPKLTLPVAAKLASYPNTKFQSYFPPQDERLPLLKTMKYIETSTKPEDKQDLKAPLKKCQLPKIERKGG
ncbi:MAPK/MAK/MRK overlapping kinase isoform X2 [Microcaecilia unicolor]|uniref:MAPK/MAK/MRK overlapping kinase n=1 Tax=Microcaecilia unicolor TaxID=1415580 RepID=A0A6P7Z120_9AMPH|nr:MAPK/MAK/MRK overlapping kinase isoform X2 [Microcaecilia unicolor]